MLPKAICWHLYTEMIIFGLFSSNGPRSLPAPGLFCCLLWMSGTSSHCGQWNRMKIKLQMRFPLGKAVSCCAQCRAGSRAKCSWSNFGRFCWKGRNPCSSITHNPLQQLAYQGVRILWCNSGFEVAWAGSICHPPHGDISITIFTLASINCNKCSFLF